MGSLKNQEDELDQVVEEPILYVNGVRKVLADGLAHLTLLEYLRGTELVFLTYDGFLGHFL
jgi:xanthine dehydrogenase/oxidase